MATDFTGKNVLITGGSRGSGKACAKLFSSLNANVIVTYKTDKAEAQRTLAELNPKLKNSVCQLDQSLPKSVERFFHHLLQKYEHLDVIVNNAGIYVDQKIDEVNYDQWQKRWNDTISMNLSGVANLCYFASRQMMAQGGGKIINVSSRGAFKGEPDHPAYAASKAGLNAMSQSLAAKLAPYRIGVFVIAPGFSETATLAESGMDCTGCVATLNNMSTSQEIAQLAATYASKCFEPAGAGINYFNGSPYIVNAN